MKKPFYKYKSYWGVVAGLGLAYIYVKTLGKDKDKFLTLLVGTALGGGIGLALDMTGKEEVIKPEITEQSLKNLAMSISPDTESELANYLLILNKAKLSTADNKKAYNVLNGFLLAKKDNKWDSKADIQGMKKTLLSYGVTEDDFKVFQSVLVGSLANVITNIFTKQSGNTENK